MSTEYRNNPEARYSTELDWLKDGRELDAQYIADEFDISESTAREDLAELDSHLPLDQSTGDNGRHVYSLPVDDPSYLHRSEYDEDDVANWLKGETEGLHRDLTNHEWKEKDSVQILALSEIGLGTKFSSEEAWDGLAYVLDESDDIDDDVIGVVNGGLLPRVDKRSYKTARQYQRALGEDPEKEPNATASRLADKEGLREMLGDDQLPDDPDEAEAYLDDLVEGLEEMDLEGNEQKITNMQEATDVASRHIDKLYDALDEDFPLYVHMGEQDEQNIEELEDLKIQELTEDEKERMERLEEKIESRNSKLRSLNEELAEYEDDYDELMDDIEQQLQEEEAPHRLDLGAYDIDDELDVYEEALDIQKELVQDIREMELNRNAMMIEQAFGQYADVFNRTFLKADQAELTRKLAETEYSEYIRQVGNVEDIATESELMTIEEGGFDIDVAHNMNIASDEPLKTGFKKEKEKYKNRTDGQADLFLTGHHGPFKAQQFVHGRGEDEMDHTWVTALSTFMDKELLEEYGEDEGLNLIKDVKRKNKGLHDSTVSLLELSVEEGPDGEMRKRFKVKGWDGEYLKNLGEELNGDGEPGVSYQDDPDKQHIAVRGDDQIGAQHSLEYLYEPLTKEVIEEEFHHLDAWADGKDNLTIVDVGDAFQGTDIYDGQAAEGTAARGQAQLDLKESIIETFEDDDVVFDSEREYRQYKASTDLDSSTEQALSYIFDERNIMQEPIVGIDEQGELIEEWTVREYEDIMDEHDAEMILVDGNHYNENVEGLSESRRLKQMFRPDLHDDIETADGSRDGDTTTYVGDLQVRAKHRPTGYGRESIDKLLGQTLEDDTDVFVAGHYHVPSFGKQDDAIVMMPGSAQATNDFVKGFTDAPAAKGGIYASIADDPDKKEFEFEHVSVKGMAPFDT